MSSDVCTDTKLLLDVCPRHLHFWLKLLVLSWYLFGLAAIKLILLFEQYQFDRLWQIRSFRKSKKILLLAAFTWNKSTKCKSVNKFWLYTKKANLINEHKKTNKHFNIIRRSVKNCSYVAALFVLTQSTSKVAVHAHGTVQKIIAVP